MLVVLKGNPREIPCFLLGSGPGLFFRPRKADWLSDTEEKVDSRQKLHETLGNQLISLANQSAFHCFPVLSSAFQCFPVLSTAFHCFPLLSTAFQCFQLLSSAFNCFPVLSSAFHCFPLLSSAFHCFPVLSTAFQCFQLLSSAFQCFPVLSSAFQCCPVLSSAFQFLSVVFQWLPGVFGKLLSLPIHWALSASKMSCARHYPTIINGAGRKKP